MIIKISNLVKFLKKNNLLKESNYLSSIVKVAGEFVERVGSMEDWQIERMMNNMSQLGLDEEDRAAVMEEARKRGLVDEEDIEMEKPEEGIEDEELYEKNPDPVSAEELEKIQIFLKHDDETIRNQGYMILEGFLESGQITLEEAFGIPPLKEIFS